MSQSRVRHSDIEVGKPLPWDVVDEKGVLLLSKGYLIANEGQIDRLVAKGIFADTAALRVSRLQQLEAGAAEEGEPQAAEDADLLHDWMALRQRMEQSYEQFQPLIDAGHFVGRIKEIAQQVIRLCAANPEMAQAIISLIQDGRYSARHMLDTAATVSIAARALKLTEAREFDLVRAALTMNLGTTAFQDEIKKQTDPLTELQLMRLYGHPEEATAILKRIGVNTPIWLRAVLEHHEQLDGQGYPNRIAGAEFSADGQLLRLADVYCARVSFREYRSAVPLTVALRDILQDKGKTVEPALAAQFIRAMGIFPPGLKLRLANGEIGVVVRAGESPNHPVVVVLVAANGEAMAQGVYRDTRNPAYAVGDTVNPATFKAYVDIAAIWGS